jgi:hypothetical protein
MGSGHEVADAERFLLDAIGGEFGPGTRHILALEASLDSVTPAGWSRLARLIVDGLEDYGETVQAMGRIFAAIDRGGFPLPTFAEVSYRWITEKVENRLAHVPDDCFEFDGLTGRTVAQSVRALIAEAFGQMAVGFVAMHVADPDDIGTISVPIALVIPMNVVLQRAQRISHPLLGDQDGNQRRIFNPERAGGDMMGGGLFYLFAFPILVFMLLAILGMAVGLVGTNSAVEMGDFFRASALVAVAIDVLVFWRVRIRKRNI